jgi:hypothetical protein
MGGGLVNSKVMVEGIGPRHGAKRGNMQHSPDGMEESVRSTCDWIIAKGCIGPWGRDGVAMAFEGVNNVGSAIEVTVGLGKGEGDSKP